MDASLAQVVEERGDQDLVVAAPLALERRADVHAVALAHGGYLAEQGQQRRGEQGFGRVPLIVAEARPEDVGELADTVPYPRRRVRALRACRVHRGFPPRHIVAVLATG